MDTPSIPPRKPAAHPLLLAAAIAVLLFCAIGIAAVMGWIPSSLGHRGDLTAADRMAAGTPVPATAPYAGREAAPYSASQSNSFANAAGVPAVPPSQMVQSGLPAAAPAPVYDAPAPAPAAPAYDAPRPLNPPPRLAVAAPAPVVHDDAPARQWCGNCGNIESVREVTTRARGSGLGAAGGAVLGGLLGNQIGGGSGRSLATVAGAVGGAVVGNQVEGNMKANHSYQIRVRLDDGTVRVFNQHAAPRWRNGDRVRIVKGALHSV